MRKLLMGRRRIGGKAFSYFLLTQEWEGLGESYGVEIAAAEGDSARIDSVTLSQNRILLLMGVLIAQTVTPVTLRDVVEDWILAS